MRVVSPAEAHTAYKTALRAQVSRQRQSKLATLSRIRCQPHAIGGYAVRFDHQDTIHGQRMVVLSGAFGESLRRGGWFLLHNHAEGAPSLASMAAGTLHVEADSYGLWVEACLPGDQAGARMFAMVKHGLIRGLSIGESSRADIRTRINAAGVIEVYHLAPWEVSLISSPYFPAASDAWVRPSADALASRSEFLAISRRRATAAPPAARQGATRAW